MEALLADVGALLEVGEPAGRQELGDVDVRAREASPSAATCPNRPFLMLPMVIAGLSRSFPA
ncbi:hypothetical protein, partial [Streptomyces sp. NPDC058605]|uniref:hypothetical protein n=1 Tax=Streptomyces sp. NPDC058605 TaxID=3346552 RepID=UPI003667E8A3